MNFSKNLRSAAACCVLLMACRDGEPDGPDAGSDADGDADSDLDVDASGSECAAPREDALPWLGDLLGADVATISLSSRTEPGSTWSVGAYFFAEQSCDDEEMIGGCRICRSVSTTAHDPPRGVGEIQITTTLETVALQPGADGSYGWTYGAGPTLFAPGESIAVLAAGGFYPSFDETFAAPALAEVSVAGTRVSGDLVASATDPLRVDWSGSDVADELVVVTMSRTAADYVSAECVFLAADSTCGEVPAEVVAGLADTHLTAAALTHAVVTTSAGTITIVASVSHDAAGLRVE